MFISEQRTVQVYKISFFENNGFIYKNLILPARCKSENLDYAVNISELLKDGADNIINIQAIIQEMNIDWLSFWKSYILMKLGGGTPQSSGKVALNVTTSLGRRFNLSLTQKIKDDLFDPSPPQSCIAPNHVAFPGTTSLTDPNGSVFIFG
ncbi:MAG: hypothetical protein ACRCVY_07565 [Commensalibacter sp.]